jgi:hypothetical protein
MLGRMRPREISIVLALFVAACGEPRAQPAVASSPTTDIFDARAEPADADATPLSIARADAAPEDLAEPVSEMVVMGHEAPRRVLPSNPPDNHGPFPPPRLGEGPSFDRGATASALATVDGSGCAKNGPTGTGHVKLTFSPAGNVAVSEVDSPPFAGTDVGKCVAKKFARVRVPAFVGSSVVVGVPFKIPP